VITLAFVCCFLVSLAVRVRRVLESCNVDLLVCSVGVIDSFELRAARKC